MIDFDGAAADRPAPFGRWLWPAMLAFSAGGAGVLGLADVHTPARATMTLWFLLVCPGMAYVRLLRVRSYLYTWSLAVALSLALDSLVAETMLYVGVWSPTWGLAILIGLSLVGLALELARSASVPEEAL
jgi:hypothetical protein